MIREENKGLAAARNARIGAAQGEYIFPLDAGDWLRHGWIDEAVGILQTDPEFVVVYGDAQRFGTQNFRWSAEPFDTDRLLYSNVIHTSALYRRSVWEQSHGDDGRMPVHNVAI